MTHIRHAGHISLSRLSGTEVEFRMPTRLALLLLLLAAAAPLPPELSNPETVEGWIWQKVQAGESADLKDRCKGETLDIRKRDDAIWKAPCRSVSPNLLRALLTEPRLADHSPHGVRIRGVHINGSLDLEDAHIKAAIIMLDASWITGDANLDDARLDGSLKLINTLIERKAYLRRAYIGGQMEIDGSIIANQRSSSDENPAFNAERLHVGPAGLNMRHVTFDGPVDLLMAHIDGQMDMEGAIIGNQKNY